MSQDVIFLKPMLFAPVMKLETVELGDIPAVKKKAEAVVKEDKDDNDDDTRECVDEASDADSEARDDIIVESEPIVTTLSS